jgi:hypothetical protein
MAWRSTHEYNDCWHRSSALRLDRIGLVDVDDAAFGWRLERKRVVAGAASGGVSATKRSWASLRATLLDGALRFVHQISQLVTKIGFSVGHGFSSQSRRVSKERLGWQASAFECAGAASEISGPVAKCAFSKSSRILCDFTI